MEYRKGTRINDGWKSILFDAKIPSELPRAGWINVEVPHNWERYHGYHKVSHGNLHGTAWYRKNLTMKKEWQDKHIHLLFEGVGSYADIWLNDIYVGGHRGGRTCFSLDITEYLNFELENVLFVRASHPEKIRDLPWVCGGCYGTPNSEGSQPLGIFRPVHIQVTGPIRIIPFGILITTPSLTEKCAMVRIQSELKNLSMEEQKIELIQELISPLGKTLAQISRMVPLSSGEEKHVVQLFNDVLAPLLWSPDTPVLYKIRTIVRNASMILDKVENSFGFREFFWENFEGGAKRRIDRRKLLELPGKVNENFVSYLRGGKDSSVAIVPGGVHVKILDFSSNSAVISLETLIKNQDMEKHDVQLESFIQTFNQTKSIANLITRFSLEPGEEKRIVQVCDPLNFPDLWSEEDPFLHNVVSTVRDVNEDLKEYCQTGTSFGIRRCEGLANKGNAYLPDVSEGEYLKRRLMINGKPYFLNGTCEYEHELGNDHAFTDEMIHARIEMIRAAGFNALREAHCPHNLRYLELCDRLGLLYWAQMGAHIYFDTEEFQKNFLMLTEEWVRERRNSPSLFLWSIQNESMLPSDFGRVVTERIRRLDGTSPAQRKVVTCNGGTGSDWNIPQNWSGTYGGDAEDYGKEAVKMRLVGEYGQYRVKGKHQEGDMRGRQNAGGDVCEELFAYSLETKLREGEKVREYFYGHFQWIFSTHANPGRELFFCLDGKRETDIGVVNNKGLFTSWGEPLDAYYMYRSNYISPEKEPFVYIVSHSWPDRFVKPGKGDIMVYSNCEEVELYNDHGTISMGKRTRSGKGWHAVFSGALIRFDMLTAKGYVNGKCVAVDRVEFPALPPAGDFFERNADFFIRSSEKDLYRVNCGGEQYKDIRGFIWSADQGKAGNRENWKCHSWGMDFENVGDTAGSLGRIYDRLENTEEGVLFQTFRYGREELWYQFPVEPGGYLVELCFIEPWYGMAGEDASGWRLFDVAVNGEVCIKKLDIWKEAGGAIRALRKEIKAIVENGEIRIGFPRVYSNQALICTIRIASLDEAEK